MSPSKESLERGRKLRHKLRLGFQYAKEETAFDEGVADLLDEAIREARVSEHLKFCERCGVQFSCERLVRLREGKT